MVGDATPPIIPKIAGFVPICALEDIGTEGDWAAPAGCSAVHIGYAPGCLRRATGKTPMARADRSRSKAMAEICTLPPLAIGYELFAIPPPPSRR